jgi:hypothetical protein
MSDTAEVAELLHATLANAVRAPYYARAFGESWRDIVTVEGLAKLPLLDRRTALAHQAELLVGDCPRGAALVAGSLARLSTPEEIAAIRGEATNAEDDDWVLVVGEAHSSSSSNEIALPWSYDARTLSRIDAYLSQPQPDGRRVTSLRVEAEALKTYAMWLLERGTNPVALGLKRIDTYGSRVSGRWRDLITKSFETTLYDNYTLSAAPTPATECKSCTGMHFGWPPLIWEVLDLHSGAPIEQGVGRLVVTTAYPWVQKLPLVRYDTGDVVALGAACEATGEPRVDLLGPLRRGVLVPGGTFELAPLRVQDVLESMRDTERSAHPAVTNHLVRSRELGAPRWVAALEDGVPHLQFEARFDPLVFPKTARSIEEHVATELGGEIAVTARAPGSLGR